MRFPVTMFAAAAIMVAGLGAAASAQMQRAKPQ